MCACFQFFADMAGKDEAMEALKKEAVDLVLFFLYFRDVFVLVVIGVDCSAVSGLIFAL